MPNRFFKPVSAQQWPGALRKGGPGSGPHKGGGRWTAEHTAGYAAHDRGRSNPHEPGTQEHTDWQEGFDKAKAEEFKLPPDSGKVSVPISHGSGRKVTWSSVKKLAGAPATMEAGSGQGPTAQNIQGQLHVGGYMGEGTKLKRRKKKKVTKLDGVQGYDPLSLYIHRPVVNAAKIIAWAKEQGFKTTIQPEDLHCTVTFSRKPLDWTIVGEPNQYIVRIPEGVGARTVQCFGDENKCAILRFECPELEEEWSKVIRCGASWDHQGYKPHITISWECGNIELSEIAPYQGEIILGPQVYSEIVENWQDSIVEKQDWRGKLMAQIEKVGARHSKKDTEAVQAVHDHAVALGAKCLGHPDEVGKAAASIVKVDQAAGVVFGWGIICKSNGADYYDLNVDPDGTRCPEHIPEDAMFKAAIDFALNSRAGNEMHGGPDIGTYAFVFPMTADIAKAYGISTNTTGLMIAYKPPADVLAKFVDGTYKGFSIEGRRVSVVETED